MQGYSFDVQVGSNNGELRLRRLSMEAWIDLPEHQSGEWVDGWLVEEEWGSYLHDLIVAWFIGALRAWAVPRRGSVTASNFKFLLSDERGRKPDVAVFLPAWTG